MYYNGQVVHDLEKEKPVIAGDARDGHMWAWENVPKKSVPYVDNKGSLFLPKNVADAFDLLRAGSIRPQKSPPLAR